MSNHKFHGIALAANSTFENLVVERLAATPASLTKGRVWYNTTDNSLYYTDLDGQGAIRVNKFAAGGDLQTAITNLTNLINAETARAEAAEAAEAQARADADTAQAAALATEVAARTAADSTEQAARQSGDATVTAAFTAADVVVAQNAADALAAETNSRVIDDAALNTRVDGVVAEINVIETSVGLNADGTLTAPENTTNLGTITTVKGGLIALDSAIAAESAARVAADQTQTDALAAEVTRATNAENNLQTQLTEWVNTQLAANAGTDAAEKAARIAADAAIQAEVDAIEASAGLATDGSYVVPTGSNYLDSSVSLANADLLLDGQIKLNADAVAAEATARATADASFQSQLTTEINSRTTAVTNLQNELNTTQAGAGLQTDGTYVVSTGANYIASATSLADADNKLDTAVKAVSDRVGTLETTVISEVQASVTAEVTRATTAEAALQASINALSTATAGEVATETARAEAAEAALQSAIAAEVTRATGIEAGLQSQISGEVTARTNADANLQSQINAIVAASGEGAAALKTELNAARYAFTSSAPALVHTVTTNLGTLDFSVDLKVQGQDGVWRNDIAPIEFAADGNSFTVTLTESSNIKVSGQSNAQLA